MKLLIDAWNVLHQQGVLPPELAVDDLAGLVHLIRLSRWRDTPIDLVCDGRSGSGPDRGRIDDGGDGAAGVRVRWSGPARTADDLIIETVRKSDAPRSLLVVTSDRAIQREARRRRCRILTSEAFLERLSGDVPAGAAAPRGPGRPTAPLSPGDVQRWAKRLGVPLDDPSVLEALRREHAEAAQSAAPPKRASEGSPDRREPSVRDDENTSPDAAAPATSPAPAPKPAAPVLPDDLLAEALALLAADDAADAATDADAAEGPRPDANRGGQSDARSDSPSTTQPVAEPAAPPEGDERDTDASPPAAPRGAPVLPDDILAEAMRMASVPAPPQPAPAAPRAEQPAPPAAPPAAPPREPLLPDDILGEALQMMADPDSIERSAPAPVDSLADDDAPLRDLPADLGPFDDAILREAAEMLDLQTEIDTADSANQPDPPADE